MTERRRVGRYGVGCVRACVCVHACVCSVGVRACVHVCM